MGGLLVSATNPKKVVLPPSGAVIDGFWVVTARGQRGAGRVEDLDRRSGRAEGLGAQRALAQDRERGDHQGTAPTPIVLADALWPNDVG